MSYTDFLTLLLVLCGLLILYILQPKGGNLKKPEMPALGVYEIHVTAKQVHRWINLATPKQPSPVKQIVNVYYVDKFGKQYKFRSELGSNEVSVRVCLPLGCYAHASVYHEDEKGNRSPVSETLNWVESQSGVG